MLKPNLLLLHFWVADVIARSCGLQVFSSSFCVSALIKMLIDNVVLVNVTALSPLTIEKERVML